MNTILQFVLEFRFFYLPLILFAAVLSLFVGAIVESARRAEEEGR